ncbi:pericentrin isoform X2 [Aotus nancymaae]|uniref:pericentrin isoform X2 n=1 Tax=Aotus nancymaae TaxID=37293 RepID=UPI0030FE910D
MEAQQEQRRRKVEAGRAKLAHFRQRKTKGDGAHSEKKTAKRKGPAVDAAVQEESPVAKDDSEVRGGGDIYKSPSCDHTPGGAGGAFAAQLEDCDGEKREDLEQLHHHSGWWNIDHHPEQHGAITVSDHHPGQRGAITISDHPGQHGAITVSDHHPGQRGAITVSDHHPEQRGAITVSDHHPEQSGAITVSDHHPEQCGAFTVSDHHPEQRGAVTVSDHHPEQRGAITVSDHAEQCGAITVSDHHPEQCGAITVSDHHPGQRGAITVSDHHPGQREAITVSDHHPGQRGVITVSDHHPGQHGAITVSDHHPEQRGAITISDHHPGQHGAITVSDHHPGQRGAITISDHHPEQRGTITKECEQECELVTADMESPREDEAGPQQSQAVHGLELEALRLSLSNMHTAQLELTQANLQKEKETALTELREMLNSRRAQELALLQSRQQHELGLLREQHALEKEEVALRCGREAAELKEKLQSEMEKSAQIIKTLKEDWESEKDLCLENLRKELSAKHQSEMKDLQNQFQKELAEQKVELEKIFQDKNQAEWALRNLESQHQAAIEKLREDLQSKHCRYLEDLELKFKENEKEKQLELENLQASYEDLKAQSQEEIRHLWSQLDSARTSRQELSELHEQLLACASHVEDLEQLKQGFEQQQQQAEVQHESELERLRIYFERKLRDAEKAYQDLTLLQQRLQGAREDALLDSVEVSSSCMDVEETLEKEKKDHLDKPEPERHKESLPCFQVELEESHRPQLEALESPLCIQHEGHVSDRRHVEAAALGQAWRQEPSEGHSQELPWVHLQDGAVEADTEVAARVLGLETEHKVKLSLLHTELKEEIELLKIENRNLYEKLQHEIRLKEDLEKVKHSLVEDHQEELNNAMQKIQLMKQEFRRKEVDWKVTREELQREAEEKLTLMLLELREKAESEKQSVVNKFELREAEMRQLQDQQAAQILDLERSLTEQQGRLQQLEQELTADEAPRCSHCGREPPAAQDGELAALRVKEDCALQLMLARSRFLEERKEITEKFSAEQDAFLREAQEQHARELQLLQEKHQQRLLSVTAELEARHQAALGELTASLENKQGALLAARVAELQTEHAADLSALENRHLSSLDSLESCYLSEIQTIREEHRRALELLRADFEEQLRKKDSLHRTILTQELEKLKQKHDGELQSVRDGLRAEASPELELQGAHQAEFGSEKKATLPEKEETHRLQSAQPQPFHQEEKESLSLQLQKKNQQVQQLKDQVFSLSHEIEECRAELEALQQRRERENQEGANLLSMLRADADLSHSERGALQDALRRLLGLFGETLRAAITLRSRIGERVGLCLDDAGTGLALSAAPALEETWSDAAVPELDRTLSECAEMSSVAEISSHVRESFLMSPESVRECEQPIRRIFQSLSLAVDGLLEMALDSSRQLEEARQIHSRFEKEFSFKNEETAQVVRKHQELLECLKEESAAKAELALELHKTQGTLEGFKVETADLQKALAGKEDSEHRLVLELESLRRQLQQAVREQAALREECARLWSQGEAAAADAEAREAGTAVTAAHKDSALRKKAEDLVTEQSETRKQAEKDRSALLAQMKILELELEEQLSQHLGCAKQAEAVTALEQQVASLDKHLRSQRQFMDEQATEREHEREEFQQEIQRLEGQLRQAAKPQPWGPHDSQAPLDGEVELLQQKLREKSDEFNELALQKESADRQVSMQEDEIERLEEMNVNMRKRVAQLQEELENQKNIVKELEQDKETLKEQQMSSLLLASTLQSTLDTGRYPEPPSGSPPQGPEAPLEVTQSALLQRESEVLDLKEQLEKIKGDLVSKNEEIQHLNLKLDLQNDQTAISLRELQEENVSLKAFLHNKEEEILRVSQQLQAQQGGMASHALGERRKTVEIKTQDTKIKRKRVWAQGSTANQSAESSSGPEGLDTLTFTEYETEGRVTYTRSSEIEELKATIENLQENQKRLQKEKAEEIEQLHEVIEKLQQELSLMGPVLHEVGHSQAGSLQSELLCSQAGGPGGQALQGKLEAALEAKEAVSRLLAEREHGHSQALQALQRRLQGAEEAAERQLAELERSAALREAEVEGMASRIQEFEAALRAKEVMIAERDLEIHALNQRKVAHSAELEAVLSALARLRRALEQQPLTALAEPPELQRLRAQCARLSRQLQVLHQRFLRCRVDPDKRQACGAAAHAGVPGVHPQPRADGDVEASHDAALEPAVPSPWDDPPPVLVTLKDAPLCKQEGMMSVLSICQRQLQSELLLVKNEMRLSPEDSGKVWGRGESQEEVLADCQLPKVDLIAQVKQLQEKLSCLLDSMTFQDVDAADTKSPRPVASARLPESRWSDGSRDGEEPGRSAPVDVCDASTATGELTDVIKHWDSSIPDEAPDSPIQERSECQDGPRSSPTSLLGGPHHQSRAREAGPRKAPVRMLDLSSWSSPEVLRKDWTLEPQPSLPLTPHSGALSLPSADTSPRDRADVSLLQAQGPGLLCYPSASAAALTPKWAGSPPADLHVERTAVEKDVEDFITSCDPQETLSSSPGLEGKIDGSEKSDGSGFGARLSPGSGGLEAHTAGPVTPAPISGGFQPPPEAMKEKEVHPKHMKALLQMVRDESHQILALSEGLMPPSALGTGEPHPAWKGNEDLPTTCHDWSGEFLQVVQEAFEKEQEMQGVELQPQLGGSDPEGRSSLLERLEKVIREQGDLQEKSLEHLRLLDRSSLLSEIQALRAQLRMTRLQNQEKLQHLLMALTSAEARGSQQEHQLRRQVELLTYKVEQEKSIAGDLQKTLREEEEKANGLQKLLAAEQSAVRDLKSELFECRQESERLSGSLHEVQQEVLQLRSVLTSKENELKAVRQELESEQGKGRALQSQLEEEQLRHLQREGQNAKALEELRASLETQRAQSSRLRVALKHEQVAKDNVQKELCIEHSRCEALLAQERVQLSDLQKDLAAEKSRTLELSEALRHERLLTEQLSQRTQEACVHQDTRAQHTLLQKLREEKSRVVDLQAMLGKVRSQQQLEAEARKHSEELRREKERELELQRQRDLHKIRQLQQMVRDLESKDEAPGGRLHPDSARRALSSDVDHLQEQQRELEAMRQRLLCAAGLLTSFASQATGRTINDRTSANEKAVASLLHTLEELKSELSRPTSSQKKMAAELQLQFVDVLLKDNVSLTKALSTVTREKLELSRAVAKLEKMLKQHLQKGCTPSRPDRSAWKPDEMVPESSLRRPDPGRLPPAASGEASTSNVKMEKLYLHYLRAESFRKALIYQKKYLLLLIGGFQDSEQETLSMIAHLGVFPSKAEQRITSRPVTKFRTAVRVVIAILRLRFLVKKWQEVDRKGAVAQGRAPRPGPRARRPQQSPPRARESPPTRDVPLGHARDSARSHGLAAAASPHSGGRATPPPNSRLERSLTASQDPEHSLTEYIHHLEVIQQRLGGAIADSISKKSCHQKIKQ